MTVYKSNPDDSEKLKERLSKLAYRVTQQRATEPPFTGNWLKHKKTGRYHCIVCDTPLFSSEDKYESGSGWPSFSDVVEHGNVKLVPDKRGGMQRTEALCATCEAHLGHVFDDGPKPTGKRYCINSCALDFEETLGVH